MANNEAVQGIADENASKSTANSLAFFVRSILKKEINTASLVRVVSVNTQGSNGAAGRVTVQPLICSTDAQNNTIASGNIYDIPYCRYQGGKVAVICDPMPEDIGVAVFCQSDNGNIDVGTTEPQQPGSFRSFDMADGLYIGGFLNQKPATFIELKQDNTIVINAENGISVKGNITVTGDVIANGISLINHVHGGVEPGGGTTSKPV